MIKSNFLEALPKTLKCFVGLFVIVLSVGYTSAFMMLEITTSFNLRGIEENYLGNEGDEETDTMKFKKSKYEVMNIVHTHILSLSIIFFLLGIHTYGAKIPHRLKLILILEPLISVLLTFGGIYFLWSGIVWMKYIIVFSGTLMTLCFFLSVFFILRTLTYRDQKHIKGN